MVRVIVVEPQLTVTRIDGADEVVFSARDFTDKRHLVDTRALGWIVRQASFTVRRNDSLPVHDPYPSTSLSSPSHPTRVSLPHFAKYSAIPGMCSSSLSLFTVHLKSLLTTFIPPPTMMMLWGGGSWTK